MIKNQQALNFITKQENLKKSAKDIATVVEKLCKWKFLAEKDC